nr:uncharacterized protein LOC123479645 isoform X2 [Desmodus rotundus]
MARGLWRLLLSSAHGGATTLLEGGGKRHTAQMNCRSCPVWRGRDLHRAGSLSLPLGPRRTAGRRKETCAGGRSALQWEPWAGGPTSLSTEEERAVTPGPSCLPGMQADGPPAQELVPSLLRNRDDAQQSKCEAVLGVTCPLLQPVTQQCRPPPQGLCEVQLHVHAHPHSQARAPRGL